MAFTLTSQEYQAAYREAPKLVQATLTDPATQQLVESIRNTYQLHVDSVGSFSNLLQALILGRLSPDAFYKELLGLGIKEADATSIIKEINTKLFQPLQKRMREESSSPIQEDDVDEASYDPRFDFIAEDRAAIQTPSPTPLTQTETAIPTPPKPQVIINSELASVIAHPQTDTRAYYETSPLPHARTMAGDMEFAAHGLTGQPTSPARSFQTASVPMTFTPQQFVQTQQYAQPTQPSPQLPAFHPAPAAAPLAAAPFAPTAYGPAPSANAPAAPIPSAWPTAAAFPPISALASEPTAAAPAIAPVRLTPVDRDYGAGAPLTKQFGSDPYREPI